ncbi:MAG TPA: TIGR02757 family protein [Holophagaceae bacterium]|nr:TIGR02757 family protein [Holophagaceae bacterium]
MKLRAHLEALKAHYDRPEALVLDPLTIPLRFPDPADRELVAWVAATLAYGKVAPMMRAIDAALAPLGPEPARWLRERTAPQVAKELRKALSSWVWRFHTAEDLIHWLLAWKRLDATGGLEAAFRPEAGETPDAALSRLVQRLRREGPDTYGFRFSLPDPAEGGACKRWRMFLRWMVRPGWPDLGVWKGLEPAALIIPLDTHVARTARFIGLSARTTPDGRMALEVTEGLKKACPEDPLTFDFAISHLGILGDCPGVRHRTDCRPCPLYAVCRAGR